MSMRSISVGDYLEVWDPWDGRTRGVVVRLGRKWLHIHALRQGRPVHFRAPRYGITLGDLPHQPEDVKAWAREVRAQLHDGTWAEPVSGLNNGVWPQRKGAP